MWTQINSAWSSSSRTSSTQESFYESSQTQNTAQDSKQACINTETTQYGSKPPSSGQPSGVSGILATGYRPTIQSLLILNLQEIMEKANFCEVCGLFVIDKFEVFHSCQAIKQVEDFHKGLIDEYKQ